MERSHVASTKFSLACATTVQGNERPNSGWILQRLIPRSISKLKVSPEWRPLGGVEAHTGTLMGGWSTALMLSLVTWIYKRRIRLWKVKQSGRTNANRLPAADQE
jgi:hypothetical protein